MSFDVFLFPVNITTTPAIIATGANVDGLKKSAHSALDTNQPVIVVPMFGGKLLSLFGNNEIVNNIKFIYDLVKWPITIFLIYVNLKMIYTIAPSIKINSKSTTSGALFTTIIWTITTAIFSYYLKYFANYSAIYGSLSNLIILMMWLYIISYVFVLGLAINVTNLNES